MGDKRFWLTGNGTGNGTGAVAIRGIVGAALGVVVLAPAALADQSDISDYLESVRAQFDLPALATVVYVQFADQ